MKKILMVFLCLFLICGCKEKTAEEPKNVQNNNEQKEEKNTDIKVIDVNSKTRPYAVMIGETDAALPQSGLNDAYIVYEIMIDYQIPRMMALFKDQDTAKIGSVRSARTQFIDYVYENDAIYTHAGGAKDALTEISNKKIDDINPDGIYGFRDKTLNRSTEHTLFTSIKLLIKASNDKSLRTTTETPNLLSYSTEEIDLSKYSTAKKANEVSIKYSSARTSIYKYDETNKNYLRFMDKISNVDLVSKEQYTAKNIIAYEIKYEMYKIQNSSTQYYKMTNNIGSGEGYYISNGYAVPITWEKKDEKSQTVYRIKETGEKLIVNDGNTYIQIYPTTGNMTIN